jgi:monoamine oxidase
LERNFNTRLGAQMWWLHGGTQLLAMKIARVLGERVLLGSPVEGVVRQGSQVTVHSSDLEASAHPERALRPRITGPTNVGRRTGAWGRRR